MLDAIDIAEDLWSGVASGRDAQIYALSTRILYVSSLVQASFEAGSARHGLNSGEMLVLDALFRLGAPYEASPARLKDHFFISFAGIGKRLARLEACGFIERRINDADRRGQIIRLTEAGRALLHEDIARNESPHVRALRRIAPGELGALSAMLKNLQAALEAERATG
jgi:DNA-binding MarR family transcriptional regulator